MITGKLTFEMALPSYLVLDVPILSTVKLVVYCKYPKKSERVAWINPEKKGFNVLLLQLTFEFVKEDMAL